MMLLLESDSGVESVDRKNLELMFMMMGLLAHTQSHIYTFTCLPQVSSAHIESTS